VRIIQRGFVIVCSLLLTALPAWAVQTPPPQEGFVPINELPPGEQLPAAPFLIGAYAFFLVLMVGYVWTVARRLNKVEREMKALEQRSSQGSIRR